MMIRAQIFTPTRIDQITVVITTKNGCYNVIPRSPSKSYLKKMATQMKEI